MSSNKTLNECTEAVKDFKQKLQQAAENTESVKSGDIAAEDEKQEPDYRLYDGIADTVINIFQMESVEKLFVQLSKSNSIDDNFMKNLIDILVTITTHAAYGAVVWYDSLLKAELDKAFDNYGNSLNMNIATTKGMEEAMKVFRKRLGEVEKKIAIDSANLK